MDADDLINKEQFFYGNCILFEGSKIVGFDLKDNKVFASKDVSINEFDMVDIFFNFSVRIGNIIYAGGESSAHGSCGFFCKKIDGKVLWFLMSVESDPFVGVDCQENKVSFLSSSGCKWVVLGDDILNTSVVMELS